MRSFALGIAVLLVASSCAAATHATAGDTSAVRSGAWDAAAAAKYLDSRQEWWQEWPHAQKDHGTVCVSCHTQVPYALARPLLRKNLGEQAVSDPERAMLDSIIKRVKLGDQVTTFYTDAEHGPGKTKEARNAEAVNNALILVSYESANAKNTPADLKPATEKAFAAMWALQEQTGSKAGAWIWQNFHFSPWEAPESEYAGAAMAAIAVETAPGRYAEDAKIQPNLNLLRGYLRREEPNQPLINRITLLWAAAKMPGLMTEPEKKALAAEVYAKQHEDGGWCLTDLGQGTWKRHDATPYPEASDGYATGLIVLALEENGLGKSPEAKRGIGWILANQDKAQGLWPASSVNVKRDPKSDIGKFMSDAATGYAVLALEERR
jgi:hypothetical protein